MDDEQSNFLFPSQKASRTGPKMNPAACGPSTWTLTNNNNNNNSGKTNTRASLACLPCRSRHLKCDGNRPHCGRCLETAKRCHYPQSRRGGLDRAALDERRRRLAGGRNDDRHVVQASYSSLPLPPSGILQDRVPPGTDPLASHLSGSSDLPHLTSDTASPTDHRTVQFGSSIENDHLVNAYYEYFHKLHPVVLPQIHLVRLYQDPGRQQTFKPLIAILRFIGHIYSSREWPLSLRDYVETCISQAAPTDPILVQCRLLYSIPLFWFGYRVEAKREIDAAARLALDLQMFRKEFAGDHGAHDAVLTECWRRTWWMLYVVDAYYAGTLGVRTNMTMDVEATAELPCEESEYESGEIPVPQTIQEFDCRDLAPEVVSFSSFAYLIGAVRCVVLAISSAPKTGAKEEDSPHLLQVANAIINGWFLLLPKSHKQVISKTGEIDELMFQAHLGIHVASIGLHRPLSDLTFNPVEEISSCARDPPFKNSSPELINVHTARVLRSVEAQIQLLALPVQCFHHTPFITCMVSEGMLALLSASRFLLSGKELEIARGQIRMIIGCLKELAEIWPRTARNVREIQTIARHVLGLGSKSSETDDLPESNDLPNLSSGHGPAGPEPEAQASSSGVDDFPSPSFIGDFCGWNNPSNLGPDLSWWVNGQP